MGQAELFVLSLLGPSLSSHVPDRPSRGSTCRKFQLRGSDETASCTAFSSTYSSTHINASMPRHALPRPSLAAGPLQAIAGDDELGTKT